MGNYVHIHYTYPSDMKARKFHFSTCVLTVSNHQHPSNSASEVDNFGRTVKLNMPPVVSIDLHPAVFIFIKRKDRHPQHNFNMSVFKKQEFSGFFNEATTESDHHPKMNLKPKF